MDGGKCSLEVILVSTSSLELRPSCLALLSPWIHTESIYFLMSMFKWHTITALTWIMGKDQHTVPS